MTTNEDAFRTQDQITLDYQEFRGRCKELVDAAIAADPTLIAVRGHYYCPVWDKHEPHWWAH